MLRFALLSLVLLPSLTRAFEPGDKVVCIRSCDIKDDKETMLHVLLPGDRPTVRATRGKFVELDCDGWVPSDCLIAAKDAEAHFRQRAKLDPSDIDARCGLAMELLDENMDAALTAIDAVVLRRETWITLDRKARVLLAREETDDALAALDRALQLEPRRLQLRALRGTVRLTNGQPELALKDFDYVLERQPNSVEALRWRAWTWALLEKHDQALADLAVILERDPNNIDALLMRGQVYGFARRPDDTLRDADAALKIDPNRAEAFLLRGMAYFIKREAEPAVAAFNRALEIKPNHAEALTMRAACWLWTQPDKAIDDYTAAIKLSPKDAQHWGNRGYAWRNKKDLPKALADLNEAIRLDPKSATWFTNRGALRLEMGDYSAAIADLKQALLIDPKANRACVRLVWIYACIPDDEVRSGETALKLLSLILKSETDEDDFGRFGAEAAAAAMAENGKFEHAVKFQHGAIALAETEEETRAARERLTLYEAGKPYRLPVKRR
jgi:tetratricopeptide (TPR) repeat protein